jgi:hypothetical protein
MARQGNGRPGEIRSLLKVYSTAGGAVALAAIAAGCSTGGAPEAPPAAAIPTVTITAADLPGKWGLASYRKDEDRDRTQGEAKSACGNPYVIKAGPTSGVMMHLADQSEPSEVFLKVDSRGNTFIGPPGPPQIAQDRWIESYADNVMIMQWVDPGVRERYGTMLFVRCT